MPRRDDLLASPYTSRRGIRLVYNVELNDVIGGVYDNDWVREWSGPQRLVDQLGVVIEYNRHMLATVGFGLHGSAPAISEATVDDMRLITPHLRRAVTIAGLLDEARAAAASFEATLDATTSGVVLVGTNMRIVHANATAATMLDRGEAVGGADLRYDRPGTLQPGDGDCGGGKAQHHQDACAEPLRQDRPPHPCRARGAGPGRRGIRLAVRRGMGAMRPLFCAMMRIMLEPAAKIRT